MVKNYGSHRVIAGAHYGLKDWLIQGIGTVILALAALYILLSILFISGPISFESWQAVFAPTFIKIVFSFVVVIVSYHFWVTIRDVWMDYVKPLATKLVLFVFTAAWLIGCAVWLIIILWRI